jgi:hypothetical protein
MREQARARANIANLARIAVIIRGLLRTIVIGYFLVVFPCPAGLFFMQIDSTLDFSPCTQYC